MILWVSFFVSLLFVLFWGDYFCQHLPFETKSEKSFLNIHLPRMWDDSNKVIFVRVGSLAFHLWLQEIVAVTVSLLLSDECFGVVLSPCQPSVIPVIRQIYEHLWSASPVHSFRKSKRKTLSYAEEADSLVREAENSVLSATERLCARWDSAERRVNQPGAMRIDSLFWRANTGYSEWELLMYLSGEWLD